MTTILFVKTSSLGDVVHNCPAVSDAARALPGAAIDWVVEEPFAGIAAMHRAVRRVIPVAVRRWRCALWKPVGVVRDRRVAARAARRALRRGDRHAVAPQERAASAALAPRHAARPRPRERARVARRRASTTCAMPCRASCTRSSAIAGSPRRRWAIELSRLARLRLARRRGATSPATSVLLTMTSRADKLWPEERWIELGRDAAARQRCCPGAARPSARARKRIAAAIGGTVVPRQHCARGAGAALRRRARRGRRSTPASRTSPPRSACRRSASIAARIRRSPACTARRARRTSARAGEPPDGRAKCCRLLA